MLTKDKREEAIEEMIEQVKLGPELDSNMGCVVASEMTCIQLYDLGYRKVNIITDENIGESKARFMSDVGRDGFVDGANWAKTEILGENP